MKSSKLLVLLLLSCAVFAQTFAQMQVEKLNRGLISVRVGSNNYLSWRLFADDPFDAGFNIYRGGTKINSAPITGATNYTDNGAAANSVYTVRAVVGGAEQADSEPARIISTMQGNNAGYIQVDLQRPANGPEGGSYAPGDASVADLDGDGEYELIIKWDPNNQKDNSQDGNTDNVFIDAYKLNGTRLWRVDLGQNVRAGAHYTQFLVYDFDGDGKAEMIVKTAPGARDATGQFIKKGPAASANHSTAHRNAGGHITAGPEFLTVFNGLTGNEDTTITYLPARDPVSGWGGAGRDNGGNRSQRFNAAVAYLDGERPSAVFQRGYYERMALWALDWRSGANGKPVLTQRWMFDSNTSGNSSYSGQGNHQMSVADANGNGKHDIITGAAVIGSDGRGMHTSRMGHGDALHVAHMIKNTKTPQIFMPHENKIDGVVLRQANNGTVLFQHKSDRDVGRGVAAELDPARPGFKLWGSSGLGLYNVNGTVASSTLPSSNNHVIWWDGELSRELLDGNTVTKWSVVNNRGTTLLSATGYSSINGTKSNPVLQADIFGDWREEVIFSNGTNAVRIYTTTMPTTHRLVTMMHDPTYRVAVAWQNSSYNQPPHPGYYIASDMDKGFPLDVKVIAGGNSGPVTPVLQWINLPGGEYIDTLRLYDKSNQSAWSVQSGLNTPTAAFGDREHRIAAIPADLQGAEWIRSSMESRTLSASSAYHADSLIRFTMKKDGTVYIAYENRVTSKPAWLTARGFSLVNDMTITVIEAAGTVRTFDIYSKNFAQGETVTMGINENSGLSNSMIYLVAITATGTMSVSDKTLPVKYAMNIMQTGRGVFKVNYAIKEKNNVRIDLFDIKGNRIKTLVNGSKNAGAYQQQFSAKSLAAGMYLVKLRSGGAVLQQRVMVAK